MAKRLVIVVSLIVLYVIVGYASLLMIVPPAYSPPIWPVSGLSLAILVLYKRSCWPIVFLAAFLLNIIAEAPGSHGLLEYIGLCAFLALGTVLSALFAYGLFKKFVGLEFNIIDEKNIVRFFIIVAPLGAVIEPCWYLLIKSHMSVYSTALLMPNLVAWWVVATVSIMIITPIAILLFGRFTATYQARLSIVFLLLAIFLIVSVLFIFLERWQHMYQMRNFENESQPIFEKLHETFNADETALLYIVNYFNNSVEVTREEFSE